MLRTHRVRSLAVLVALALLALVMAPAAPAEAAKKAPAKFVIAGSGAGHGVGMSQYGAYRLARTGSSAEQILQYYYPGTTIGWTNNNPRTVKVQVLGPPVDKRKKATIKVKGGGFTVVDTAGRVLLGTSSGKITLKVKGSGVTAKAGKKSLTASRLTVTTTGTATVTGAQGSYHYGNLQVTTIGKRLNVVNEVAMNTKYLYGLDEMPASWGNYGGAEALKAQAIAARNYVIKRVIKLRETLGVDTGDPACDCHLFDDERSQNYTGWKKTGSSANQPWVDAVKSTITETGVLILRDPSAGFAETPYFASTGFAAGAGTARNSDVFKADPLSYLPGVADPYSALAPRNPYKSWKRTLTQKQAAKVFNLKSITKIEVAETYSGGLMKTLTATATNGRTVTLSKTSRAWMEVLAVPSPWLTSIKPK
ncbi:MAG TPA: SpoIID/LytB domain-containing protein [Propionicimonas sp.]|nr:SpoIID/LytB domain-containing protein [Propionicimonas sp.]